jgi:hypothetical protein
MAGLLALYVILHSPLRSRIAALLGLGGGGCDFGCPEATTLVAAGRTIVTGNLPGASGAPVAAWATGGIATLDRLGAAVGAWVLIIAALAAGWVIVAWLCEGPIPTDSALIRQAVPVDPGGPPAYERPLIFGLSALAFIAIPGAAIGGLGTWLNLPLLRPPLGPIMVAIPALVFVGQVAWRGRWPARSLRIRVMPLRLGGGTAVAAAAGGLLLFSVLVSLAHPATGYDALGYHGPLAGFLWQDGNLTAFLERAPSLWALAQPGTGELWFGLLDLAGGERLANLGQLPFALLGAVAAGAFTRRLGLGPGSALLAGGAFLLTPIVAVQVGRQLNDVVAAAVMMSVLVLASAPVARWRIRHLGLIGVGFGLVATLKLALLPCLFAVGLFMAVETVRSSDLLAANVRWGLTSRASRLRAWYQVGVVTQRLAIVALMFLIVVSPWWVRNLIRYSNPVYPAALPLIGHGVVVSDFGKVAQLDADFVPSPLAWPLYPLLEQHGEGSGFGALFLLGLIPGFLVAARQARRRPLILFLLVVGVMLLVWWLALPHHPRFLLSISGPALAFVPWSLLAVPRRCRAGAGAVIVAAAVFSAVVTINQALLPAARQPGARTAFYAQAWGVDPAVLTLPEDVGLLYNTGYGPYTYPAYYPLLGSMHRRTVIELDRDATPAVIAATMKRAGVAYAYVVSSAQAMATVEQSYDPRLFTLVYASVVDAGELAGTRRYLYVLR